MLLIVSITPLSAASAVPPCLIAKRGGKRKSVVPKADAPEPKVKVARISNASESALVVQMSETPVAEDEIVPKPWRA